MGKGLPFPASFLISYIEKNRNRNSISRIPKTFSCGMCWCLLWLFTLCRCGVVNCDQMATDVWAPPRGHLASDGITTAPLLRVPALGSGDGGDK